MSIIWDEREGPDNLLDLTKVDQIPIPAINSIEVKSIDVSEGEIDESKIKWALVLKPDETKKLINLSEEKYPKDEYIFLD